MRTQDDQVEFPSQVLNRHPRPPIKASYLCSFGGRAGSHLLQQHRELQTATVTRHRAHVAGSVVGTAVLTVGAADSLQARPPTHGRTRTRTEPHSANRSHSRRGSIPTSRPSACSTFHRPHTCRCSYRTSSRPSGPLVGQPAERQENGLGASVWRAREAF